MSTGEQSLFFLFNVNGPSTGIRFYFWQIKSLFHGPTFWLQKTESGRIVLSKKNSGNRSCTFANNEIANNSSMSCCKMMKKAAIPSLAITNLIMLKTKITYVQTKHSMKVPINNNNNNNNIYRGSPTCQGSFQWGPHALI